MKYIIPKFSIIIIFTAIALVGIAMLPLLNLQLNPSRTLPSITVSYGWPGNEARVVEHEVTARLEAAFAQIRGIKDINSRSANGQGQVWLSLDKGVDADVLRFEISMLVRQIWQGLPQGVSYPSIQADWPDEEGRDQAMLSYIVTAALLPHEIMQYAEDEIKLKLSSVTGIGKIEVSGAQPYEWLIEYHSGEMKNLGISLSDLQQAVNRHIGSEGLGLATIAEMRCVSSIQDTANLFIPVQIEQAVSNRTRLLQIPVKNCNGRMVMLSEIATIKHIEEKANWYYRVKGLNTININIYALAGQNQLALGNAVKKKINEIQKNLPKGYRIELGYDANEYLANELYTISWRFLLALVLLLLFVLFIYRQPKFVLLILLTFIVNLSIAAIFYYLFKIEIHLYSLAGITVSLGLMTDNIIIMGDHLRNRGNLTVWLAILAGTMAMASTLIIIFFLEEKIKANLVDFALIVIVNQAVSLVTALFFVPAAMEKLGVKSIKFKGKSAVLSSSTSSLYHLSKHKKRKKLHQIFGKNKIKISLIRFQRWLYRLMGKQRWIPYTVFILGFGLPVFLLPAKWEGQRWYHRCYNASFGSETYNSSIKPLVDKVLGGSLRLFVNYVFEGSYFNRNEETSLYITASLPHGSTIEQANHLAQDMELWLRQFREIKTFQANVQARQIWINVYFKKEFQHSGFPYQLKGMAVSKAIELGGAYWGVYGFGDGFSNETRENAGMYMVKLMGYNYDALLGLAGKLKENLKKNERVQEVYILPERSWFKPDNTEFVVKMDNQKAVLSGISPLMVFNDLKEQTINNQGFATLYFNGKYENIKAQDARALSMDTWNLKNSPIGMDTATYRFGKYCSIEKELTAQAVCKENQQYRIYLQFDYIGSDKFARKYIRKTVNEFQPLLPLGYTAKDENDQWYWFGGSEKNQYWLIGLIVIIIFFICAILFESLRYPIAVILTIPVSFIGVFLTFYLFDLNFDQGGFAAFILLCGMTVSAAIYIVNDYSVLRRENKERKRNNLHLYLKAFQYKIIPILLSISATMLGFVPFLTGEKQAFWFSMAAGVCGGLVFALLGIFFYLPLFLGVTGKSLKRSLKV